MADGSEHPLTYIQSNVVQDKRSKMKFVLAAIVGCCLCLAAQADNIMDREGHLYEARARLGHFGVHPFTDLYVNYVAAFVLPIHNRAYDDYRNYQPSGDECVTFFTNYIAQDYNVDDIEKVVLLDACLGYLYGAVEAHVEEDKEASAYLKSNFDALKADKKLMELYEGTKINEFSEEAKLCIGNLLLDSIRIKNQFNDVPCDDNWLEMFNTFASCHTKIPAEARTTDSYVSLIYDLVKVRGNACFKEEVRILNRSVRSKYAKDLVNRVGKSLASTWSSMADQAHERMWPKQVMQVLSAVQNPSKVKESGFKGMVGITKYQQLNLRRITNILKYAAKANQAWVPVLTVNLAEAATKAINPKRDDAENRQDASGTGRYRAWVDSLCNFFRSSDDEKSFDYTTPFSRMIKMIDYPEIYGISSDDFTSAVLTKSYETASLYLSLYSCNVLTFTVGSYKSPAHNSALSYVVSFVPNTKDMVRWPMPSFD